MRDTTYYDDGGITFTVCRGDREHWMSVHIWSSMLEGWICASHQIAIDHGSIVVSAAGKCTVGRSITGISVLELALQ